MKEVGEFIMVSHVDDLSSIYYKGFLIAYIRGDNILDGDGHSLLPMRAMIVGVDEL